MLPITSLYAGFSALMLVALAIYVIRGRRKHQVSLLDGGIPEMSWRIRAHANFCEYVPLTLLLLALAEWHKMPIVLLHLMGILLLGGRVSHAYSLLVREPKDPKRYGMRVAGMMMTFTVLLIGAGSALYVALSVMLKG